MKFGCVLIFMVPTLPLNQYFPKLPYRRLRDGDSLVIVLIFNVANALARHCQFTPIFMLQKQIYQIGPTGIRTTNHSYGDWAHNLLHQKWITTIGEVWLRIYIHGSNRILEEEVYMTPPPGLVVPAGHVCLI